MIAAVTGGTGFVGRAVLDQAQGLGLKVRALARRAQSPEPGIEWVPGDLTDTAALARLVSGADVLLHIAGVVNAPDAAGFNAGNVAGTQAVMDAASAAGVKRVVLVSSLSACQPDLSDYGRSKLQGEEVVQAGGLDWTIVRPPAIFGPRDNALLDLFKAAKWGVVPLPPAGRASFIHVDDLARLLLNLLPGGPLVSGQIFAPDDGRAGGWNHADFARAIGAAVDRKVRPLHLPRPVLSLAARIDRSLRGTRAKLTPDRVSYMVHPDWTCGASQAVPAQIRTPRIDTGVGLRQTADWYRAEGWL